VRNRICRLLAITLLAVCIGVPVVEATGHWDRTLTDTGDEAVIVTIALCVGAALTVAGSLRVFAPSAAIHSRIVPLRPPFLTPLPFRHLPAACPSPPSLRI
jgi:hypothetical protein